MAQREQADVERDLAEPEQEEDHAHQEQQVVVAGHHVLGAEVEEGDRVRPARRRHEGRVGSADVVRQGRGGEGQGQARVEVAAASRPAARETSETAIPMPQGYRASRSSEAFPPRPVPDQKDFRTVAP